MDVDGNDGNDGEKGEKSTPPKANVGKTSGNNAKRHIFPRFPEFEEEFPHYEVLEEHREFEVRHYTRRA